MAGPNIAYILTPLGGLKVLLQNYYLFNITGREECEQVITEPGNKIF